ncbi:unnamed protein product [Meloidogyne enterolobii]|uniref:Uncharacterized protein n=1 Tax=Meloidogyne enterolobii TaxID=390850 RepID=A0ACB0YSJ7_MELEN
MLYSTRPLVVFHTSSTFPVHSLPLSLMLPQYREESEFRRFFLLRVPISENLENFQVPKI